LNGELAVALDRAIWRAFQAGGSQVPFPQRVVHMVNAPDSACR